VCHVLRISLADSQNFNATPDITSSTSTETRDTVILRDDGTMVSDQYTASPSDYPTLMYNDIGETETHTIQNFLGRPVIVNQGVWSQASARGTVLANLVFPKALMYFSPSNNPITQNMNKLDGFVGLKARVNVKIEVNSMPFQAGALLLHYVPYSEYMNSHTQWYSTATTTDTTAATGCPSVIMNLANTTSMEFVTPYISPYLFFNLPTGQGSFGNVVISVISPIVSATNTSATYTIWAWLSDVDIRYPTVAPTTTSFAQIGKELSKMENRQTISAVVGGIGRAASSVLPWVGLGWLASPAAAIADGAEAVLKYFGFSKPVVEAPVTRVKQSPTQYFFNYDGSDTSHKLGLSASNALTQLSGWAGTDTDEMRLDVICAKPCFKESFAWNVTQTADQSIYIIPTSPMYSQQLTAKTPNAFAQRTSMPLCAKVSSFFSLWRGTMRYKFQIVKTQFHSGRLRVSFLPYAYTDSAAIQNMPGYAYTEDIDLSSGSDFDFEVPFVSVRPWLHTFYDVATSLTSGDARNVATGIVQISVINPLVAANTVANSVDVLVSVSMTEAQFGAPIRPVYLPYALPNVAQIGRAKIVPVQKDSTLVAERREVSLLPYGTCLGEVTASLRQNLKRFSFVGRVTPRAIAQTGSAPGSTGNGFVLYPWAPVVPQTGATTVDATGAMTPTYNSVFLYGSTNPTTAFVCDQTTDLYSNIYSMYAFFRGSIRFKIAIAYPGGNYNSALPIYVYINNIVMPNTGNYSPPMQIANPVGTPTTATNLGTGPTQPLYDVSATTASGIKQNFTYQPGLAEARMILYPDKEGMIEFEVPFHASGPFCPTNYGINNPTQSRSIFYPFPTVTITGTTNSALNPGAYTLLGCTLDVFRAVGDDFSFGGLLGCPPNLLWSSAVNPT